MLEASAPINMDVDQEIAELDPPTVTCMVLLVYPPVCIESQGCGCGARPLHGFPLSPD